jgi:aminoglycoside phosphotransferase (APT) family kinase protein
VIDRARAARLIAGAFPELGRQPVRPLAEGWDNSVFVVGEEFAFRFPRRAMALPGVRREIAVLPVLAPLLPLPIPTPSYVGADDDPDEPWPFFGARLLKGTELALAGIAEDARASAATALGGFLRALHAPTTLAAARSAGSEQLLDDPMHRAWPRSRSTDTRNLLATLARDGAWAADVRIERLLDQAEELSAPDSAPVLTHGDLHIRHLLVDVTGGSIHATGVIDWGDLCISHPAIDLSFAYAAFADDSRRAFLDAYGAVDAEAELRARALAVRLSAILATYALATQQSQLAEESLRGLERAVC